jgi:RimJ/RimL family protein N-acetyltransferase
MKLRRAKIEDALILYNWSNDLVTRSNSYNKNTISLEEHLNWFNIKINNENCFFYMFENEQNSLIGAVRIEKTEQHKSIISITVAPEERGRGYASEMIIMATEDYKKNNPNDVIYAYIFTSNISSFKAFTNARYKILKIEKIKEIESYILEKI